MVDKVVIDQKTEMDADAAETDDIPVAFWKGNGFSPIFLVNSCVVMAHEYG